MNSHERFKFLLSMLTEQHLRELGLMGQEETRRPSIDKLSYAIRQRYRVFRSAHARLLGSVSASTSSKDFDYFATIMHANLIDSKDHSQ